MVPTIARSELPSSVSVNQTIVALDSVRLVSSQATLMDNGTVQVFQDVCAHEFLPLYLPEIHSATYTDLQCLVLNQTVKSTNHDRVLAKETATLQIGTDNVSIVMEVSAGNVEPPAPRFDSVVAETLQQYSSQFQQLLSDRSPYFDAAKPRPTPVQEPTQSNKAVAATPIPLVVGTVVGGVVAALVFALLFKKGREARGTSPEAMATLADVGPPMELFSVGSHRKSLVVDVSVGSGSSISNSTGPDPEPRAFENPYLASPAPAMFAQRIPARVIVTSSADAGEELSSEASAISGSGANESPSRADQIMRTKPSIPRKRMASFSTGVCSQESDLFERSYNKVAPSDEASGDLRGLEIVGSSTTGTRDSFGFESVESTPSMGRNMGEGRQRLAWTKRILGLKSTSPPPSPRKSPMFSFYPSDPGSSAPSSPQSMKVQYFSGDPKLMSMESNIEPCDEERSKESDLWATVENSRVPKGTAINREASQKSLKGKYAVFMSRREVSRSSRRLVVPASKEENAVISFPRDSPKDQADARQAAVPMDNKGGVAESSAKSVSLSEFLNMDHDELYRDEANVAHSIQLLEDLTSLERERSKELDTRVSTTATTPKAGNRLCFHRNPGSVLQKYHEYTASVQDAEQSPRSEDG